MSLRVVAPGPLTLVQDAGRPGLAAQGVGASGAFDRSATAQLHALLGDGPDAAVLEVLGGGLVLEAEADHRLAVTGGVGPVLVDGAPAHHGRVLHLHRGQRLEIGALTLGLRAYVGVAGGLDVPATLGSRSSDLMSGLGPARLAAGDRLDVGEARRSIDVEEVPALLTPGVTSVDVVLGPRHDWFTDAAVQTFLSTAWGVSDRSDRIGVRLDGPALERTVPEELPSEPCVRGSIQVTTSGQPVVLGPDHPVTGGYPVVAVVTDDHVDRLAQVRPGETVRFRRRP